MGREALAGRGQRQHGDADHADARGGRRHGRAPLRARRQHHLDVGQGADPASRPVERRARQLVHANVTINNLLPGPFETDRLRSTFAALARKTGEDAQALFEKRKLDNPARRYGTAEEFGEFCAFMCSAQASYFTGQNVVLDGGAYPGTF